MQRKALINVKGTQYVDGNDDVTEVMATGSVYDKNNKKYIIYEEYSEEDLKVTRNTIKLSENEVELIRRGEGSVDIVFKEGLKWDSFYMTPFGSMRMLFVTRELLIDESDEKKINIKIKYEILAGESKMAEYNMDIEVTYLD